MNSNTAVRETEASKAICGLFGALEALHDSLDRLKGRVECVSMDKPRDVTKDCPGISTLPQVIKDIRTAESKVLQELQTVNNMLEDLEI